MDANTITEYEANKILAQKTSLVVFLDFKNN